MFSQHEHGYVRWRIRRLSTLRRERYTDQNGTSTRRRQCPSTVGTVLPQIFLLEVRVVWTRSTARRSSTLARLVKGTWPVVKTSFSRHVASSSHNPQCNFRFFNTHSFQCSLVHPGTSTLCTFHILLASQDWRHKTLPFTPSAMFLVYSPRRKSGASTRLGRWDSEAVLASPQTAACCRSIWSRCQWFLAHPGRSKAGQKRSHFRWSDNRCSVISLHVSCSKGSSWTFTH